jgi:hypothetical protein
MERVAHRLCSGAPDYVRSTLFVRVSIGIFDLVFAIELHLHCHVLPARHRHLRPRCNAGYRLPLRRLKSRIEQTPNTLGESQRAVHSQSCESEARTTAAV